MAVRAIMATGLGLAGTHCDVPGTVAVGVLGHVLVHTCRAADDQDDSL